MPKSIVEMTVEIVSAQSNQRTLSGEEIANLIRQTYRALKEIEEIESHGGSLEDIDVPPGGQPTTTDAHDYDHEIKPASTEPKIDPRESIQDDKIICVECGQHFRVLTHTHVARHGLTPDEYKAKWGIPANQPLSARSVSEKRKEAARERNVGEQLRLAREAKRGGEASKPTEAGLEQDQE